MEVGERLNLREIEVATAHLSPCPRCASHEGYWVGMRYDRPYVQCKSCGARFERLELFSAGQKKPAAK